MPAPALDQLLSHPAIWRGGHRDDNSDRCMPTHWPPLDRHLPGGGWPRGAITEVLGDARGVGEVGLFMPVLTELSAAGRWIAWIGAPWVPFAPELAARGLDLSRTLSLTPRDDAEGLWAAEQLLGAGRTGAVLLWIGQVEERRLRRLQLAAETSSALVVMFRPEGCARLNSPAALRVAVKAGRPGIEVSVLKCRGRRPPAALDVA